MSPRTENNKAVIRRFVEADSIGYLSLEGLRRSVKDENHDFCYACYTGDYPTDFFSIEKLLVAKS